MAWLWCVCRRSSQTSYHTDATDPGFIETLVISRRQKQQDISDEDGSSIPQVSTWTTDLQIHKLINITTLSPPAAKTRIEETGGAQRKERWKVSKCNRNVFLAMFNYVCMYEVHSGGPTQGARQDAGAVRSFMLIEASRGRCSKMPDYYKRW